MAVSRQAEQPGQFGLFCKAINPLYFPILSPRKADRKSFAAYPERGYITVIGVSGFGLRAEFPAVGAAFALLGFPVLWRYLTWLKPREVVSAACLGRGIVIYAIKLMDGDGPQNGFFVRIVFLA